MTQENQNTRGENGSIEKLRHGEHIFFLDKELTISEDLRIS